jgi:DNA-binding NtrC family response regulator
MFKCSTRDRKSETGYEVDMAILIIEPNPKHAQSLAESVRVQGHLPFTTDTIKSGLNIMRKEKLDLVLVSLNGHKTQVADLLQMNQSVRPSPPVIIMGEKASPGDATEMMQLGAQDFWIKPVLPELLAKSIELLETKAKAFIKSNLAGQRAIVSQNPQMSRLKDLARKVAATSATVFIQGESGTGKELFARYIHEHSERRDKPFTALNCAALPEGLLESELFGHERGAFTGAIKFKEGKFELANGGSLLLDEVTEIPVHLQAKLLRVLQEGEIDRVGGRYPIPVDVRVIATTNVDPETAIHEGRFRKDLFYRLNVIPIKIPPLRERPDDISLLLRYFLDKYNDLHKRRVTKVSPTSTHMLQQYSWPGNVRELENIIQRAILLCNDCELTPECLLFDGSPRQQDEHRGIELMSISEMEKLMIGKALEVVAGNRTKAAEVLGISVRTLRNKLNEYRQGHDREAEFHKPR